MRSADRFPPNDAQLLALGLLAVAEEIAALRMNAARVAQGQAVAFGDEWESDARRRLNDELVSRLVPGGGR